MNTKQQVLSVSELTSILKELLENTLPYVTVEGEVSNLTRHRSGHKYFTLKDNGAQLKAVMWRNRVFPDGIKEGSLVKCVGKISVYPPSGAYQLDCSAIEEKGQGKLYEEFLLLKEKLAARGWFDQDAKVPLPKNISKVGIVTSATGAAIKDFISTVVRRAPFLKLLLRPTSVQGQNAHHDIAKAITELEATDVDLIVITRGGGSIEDMWCFNSETLALKIFESKKPIVSAVGHEIDFSISDFVADVRAATPTAAAEIVSTPTLDDYLSHLLYYQEGIYHSISSQVYQKIQLVDTLQTDALSQPLKGNINSVEQKLDFVQQSNLKQIHTELVHRNLQLDGLIESLTLLNPESVLNRGYAILQKDGRAITSEESLSIGDSITIVRSAGKNQAEITE